MATANSISTRTSEVMLDDSPLPQRFSGGFCVELAAHQAAAPRTSGSSSARARRVPDHVRRIALVSQHDGGVAEQSSSLGPPQGRMPKLRRKATSSIANSSAKGRSVWPSIG